jgi:hypothetical protein
VDDGTWAIPSSSTCKIKRTKQWKKGLWKIPFPSACSGKRTDQWMMGLGQFHPLQQVK